MGETPLVNCGPRSYSLHSIQSTAIVFTVFFANIFHTIRLILCYSKPVRLTTSLLRWGKVLWLCCAGSTLAPESLVLRRITFRHHQPSTCFLTPTGSIKPWFHTEGNLLLYASYLPLGVPNGRVHLRVSHASKEASLGGWKSRKPFYPRKDHFLLSKYRNTNKYCNDSQGKRALA